MSRPADTREHVWPTWYLKRLDRIGPPPLPWSKNGVLITDRQGQAVQRGTRQRVLLQICSPCNTELDRRFEQPAKNAVERLTLGRYSGFFSAAEWRLVGLWWTKVLLLLGNENVRIGDALLNTTARMTLDGPMPDMGWLTNGDGPPVGLSLFVFNAEYDQVEEEYSIVIPERVRHDDGRYTASQVLSMASPGFCATLVYHPGLTIDHPMVLRNECWELLHSPPSGGDLSVLPARSPRWVQIIRGGAVGSGHHVDESEASKLTALIGYPEGPDAILASTQDDAATPIKASRVDE